MCVPSARRPLDPAGVAALADASRVRIRPRVVSLVPDVELFDLTEDGHVLPLRPRGAPRPPPAPTDLEFLEDDLGAFVAQQPAVTVRDDTHDLAPGVDDLFEPVAAALDTDTLRDLVGRVVDDQEDPEDVARDWLVAEGLANEP